MAFIDFNVINEPFDIVIQTALEYQKSSFFIVTVSSNCYSDIHPIRCTISQPQTFRTSF